MRESSGWIDSRIMQTIDSELIERFRRTVESVYPYSSLVCHCYNDDIYFELRVQFKYSEYTHMFHTQDEIEHFIRRYGESWMK